jgi:UDP-N-acetylglucosamine diphosphorylase / glucose-1-phosphate thymidylyltransferase / UDP-N-acetylgalactosamine diphosphorylase / glucosamine-1-phosphate N-acetyltransferase / galactosamine-1-phosphate N-acetyltransferase
MAADVLSRFVTDAGELPAGLPPHAPWQAIGRVQELVRGLLGSLPAEFVRVREEVAVHRSATVASSAVLTGPVILSAGCQVGHGALLRGGVWAGHGVTIGPQSEIKGSLLFAGSAAAHRNYVGDSIIGRDVNLEAGVVLANHFNEREDKQVWVRIDGKPVGTGLTKFGALIGDGSRLGANAVTSPGTLLPPGSVVPRLCLVDQSGNGRRGGWRAGRSWLFPAVAGRGCSCPRRK